LGETPKAPGAVRFLPYLSGERTPHNDAAIRGAFTGLAAGTSRDDLTQAVLEGVAFGLRDSFEALKATNAQMDGLMAIGGGTGSRYWLGLIATVLGVPLHLPKGSEFGAALGAARLGLTAATGADPGGVMTPPEISETVEPDCCPARGLRRCLCRVPRHLSGDPRGAIGGFCAKTGHFGQRPVGTNPHPGELPH
jgi:xylulokinase